MFQIPKPKKIPKVLKLELPKDKMRKLAEIAEKEHLKPTQIVRKWVLEKLDEYEEVNEKVSVK